VNRGSKFSDHQTFSFLYGWLEKGYRFIESGGSFKDETAFAEAALRLVDAGCKPGNTADCNKKSSDE